MTPADQDGGAPDALVVGGGPAGLMAAEALLDAGRGVLLAEAMPTIGRKFLMAGKSGLNLSMMQPSDAFHATYGPDATRLAPMLEAFGPEDVRAWTEALGQPTFVGSSGRLYPVAMKASPLLRAWRARLIGKGLAIRTRWRWKGEADGAHRFEAPGGAVLTKPRATVLAMGGASWARLGSDGAWAAILEDAGIGTVPFAPSNVGLRIDWSVPMQAHFGQPLKGVAFHAGDTLSRGEAVISRRGLEGGGIYPLTPALRDGAALIVDLCPDRSEADIARRLSAPRGKTSLGNHLRKRLGLSAAARAVLTEFARPLPTDPQALAALLKRLPVPHHGPRPLDEAISTAGGLAWDALDDALMLRARPGTFACGEMIAWDAPTGGYLLSACMATGLWAGQHAARWLERAG